VVVCKVCDMMDGGWNGDHVRHNLPMEESAWRPSRAQWTAPNGAVWQRQERWLNERDARRFVRRAATAVAVEHSGTHGLTWLAPEERATYWEAHAAGHVDDRERPVPANEDGITYHVSTWKSATGQRLVLLSEMC
jgi:hypothetical protein